MTTTTTDSPYAFVISRSRTSDSYGLWTLDLEGPELFVPVPLLPKASFDRGHHLVWIGGYFLAWSRVHQPKSQDAWFEYQLLPYDPTSGDPLSVPPLQAGKWLKTKFWGTDADFGNPSGGDEQYDEDEDLVLVPLGSLLLNFIATPGRGTFQLWNFDPCPTAPNTVDPLPDGYPYGTQGALRGIELGNVFLPFSNYVLDRKVVSGEYAVWSFDPQYVIPLPHPPIQQGKWSSIGATHRMVAIGEYVLEWLPSDLGYRLWRFDPTQADPLVGPVRRGTLPAGFDGETRLMGFQPVIPVNEARAAVPGTIDFMRSKIKHVVYYMLENRSFDHACGWLYEHGQEGVRFIGRPGPFQGASTEYFNYDVAGKKVYQSKFMDGKLSTEWSLGIFSWYLYNDASDVLRQLFFMDPNGYERQAVPDMGGFAWNNGTRQIMLTYGNEQLPVLTGLARHFAVSDEWFCSMPSDTDPNRAFSLTGSALDQLVNFMDPPQYFYWPDQPHRPSIWKVLWANGFTDWKIYNSTTWYDRVFTWQLFLEGQIPTVDANKQDYVATIDQFYADAQNGSLPAFSYLEPVWIGDTGTTSYHPGEDIVPGERQLNAIYDALRKGPAWDETLLVVTFDEHGGIFDHVPPPYAERPWPHDVVDGFRFDMMGPRVPTILASPWIEEHTVFRASGAVPYDATSFLATLLHWCGIPKARWFMGDRTRQAPTFEDVLTRTSPRERSPGFTPPYDKQYPPSTGAEEQPSTLVHPLHRAVARRAIWSIAHGKLAAAEIQALCREVVDGSRDLPTLRRRLHEVAARLGQG